MVATKIVSEELDYDISPEELSSNFYKEFDKEVSSSILTEDILLLVSNERNIKIFKERIHYQLSYRKIGSRHGISVSRVRDIVEKVKRVLVTVDRYGSLEGYRVSETYDDASHLYSVLKDYAFKDLCKTTWGKIIPIRVFACFKREFGVITFGDFVSHFAENGENYRLYFLEEGKSIGTPKVRDLGSKSFNSVTRVMFDLFISVDVMRKLVGKEDN